MTVMETSFLPQFAGSAFPAPAIAGLSEAEQRLVTGLSLKLSFLSVPMRTHNDYYDGVQRLNDLGVSIPPQLAQVRTVVDWPRICVDPLVPVVDGFRLPDAVDVDDELTQFWQANDMDAEAPLCFLDALVYGRSYMIVGSPEVAGDPPLITVESPLNLAMNWDPRTRRGVAAYQAYEAEGVYRAVLYQLNEDVFMSRAGSAGWVIDKRDKHNFGELSVVRLTNRARAADREGRSEITPAVMNTTDSACRSLLGMEIAREFYSVPHRYVLGASESDFQDAEGKPKSAIQMAMNKFLAFERDENGDAPTVGQFAAYDPSVFTKIIDMHAQLMASYTGFPPAWFGQVTTANPASADAIRVSLDGFNRRGVQVQNQFSGPLERVMCLAWRYAHGGADLPVEMRRLETDWVDVATETPMGTTEAIQRQAIMGAVPATSDVILKRLGYSAVERDRLKIDRSHDAGAAVLAELATSLIAKEARVAKSVATTIDPAAAKEPPVVPPTAPPANAA